MCPGSEALARREVAWSKEMPIWKLTCQLGRLGSFDLFLAVSRRAGSESGKAQKGPRVFAFFVPCEIGIGTTHQRCCVSAIALACPSPTNTSLPFFGAGLSQTVLFLVLWRLFLEKKSRDFRPVNCQPTDKRPPSEPVAGVVRGARGVWRARAR